MRKTALASLALPALVAASLLAAPAHAQFGAPTTTTSSTISTNGTPVGNPNIPLPPTPATTITTTTTSAAMTSMPMPTGGIGSGMQGGVGAPIGGLDSNPYAEAPQAARALGYPYHPPGKSGSTLN